MIYFDTDVWINSFVNQETQKFQQSISIIKEYQQHGYVISNLNIQEIIFVLAKLKIPSDKTQAIAKQLLQLKIQNYTEDEIERAIYLGEKVGFKHINDCIHTAIAEKCCTEIITYNKKDFSKIANLLL